MTKRIGVLTSGGDCAGLNAAIRAITHHATETYGWQVIGIRKGTTGLINRPLEYQDLTVGFCDSALLRSGGTTLGSTNKDNPFSFPNPDGTRTDRSQDFIEGYNQLKLDALIGIGGDGSQHILRRLAEHDGINLVAIPKTIDNDLGHTEAAIGYHTAVEVATEALDRLQPTAASHQRVMVLEVMGRDAGHIALSAGVAGGADVILIPEIPYTLEHICNKITSLAKKGRTFALVIVAEAVKKENGEIATLTKDEGRPRYGGIGQYLGEKIQKITGAETRVTTLGHVQRGGQPCAWDRIIASAFGVSAVDLIAAGKFDRMVAWQNRQVVDVPIADAIARYQAVERSDIMIKTAQGLGIYVGEL
ncbi:ATP-dependent 6-phosphofructokinase [Candidatus Finniella inopinata]|uniref:ATP-dependent 6-phosphofructokinase n=1 Tax=Candidatus Finniella inopinata TaxID=1696036 RepID=A0A4Q7DJ42_9PROT|nr:ATP-dependent 6-phosphofructokinase [Candidatus Finniella inopinata]RZI46155.1 ATP-dependent 6-phosphofructokinase [Candidatus Finniella inopinata]